MRFSRFFVTINLLWSTLAAADLPLATDFQADGALSRTMGAPILVFFFSKDCEYCEAVKELYLEPMQESDAYDGTILFRAINVNSHTTITDFAGKKTTHKTFSSGAGASFTPAIRFYDFTGKEAAPELLGYQSPDFYAAFLERAIDRAVLRVREQ